MHPFPRGFSTWNKGDGVWLMSLKLGGIFSKNYGRMTIGLSTYVTQAIYDRNVAICLWGNPTHCAKDCGSHKPTYTYLRGPQ